MFKSKNSWTIYKTPIFILFWVSVWVLGDFEYGSRSQICTNLQFFFVNLKLIFKRIHSFLTVKMTFFKNICRELYWKAEMILPWTLFVKFWVSEHGSMLKNGSFSFLQKFLWGVSWKLLEIESWNFQEFHILLMQAPNPNFITIWEGHLGKYLKIDHFYMEWPSSIWVQKQMHAHEV